MNIIELIIEVCDVLSDKKLSKFKSNIVNSLARVIDAYQFKITKNILNKRENIHKIQFIPINELGEQLLPIEIHFKLTTVQDTDINNGMLFKINNKRFITGSEMFGELKQLLNELKFVASN